jgi:hypothetical protein
MFGQDEDIDDQIEKIVEINFLHRRHCVLVIGRYAEWFCRYYPEDGIVRLGCRADGFDRVNFENRLRKEGYQFEAQWFRHDYQIGDHYLYVFVMPRITQSPNDPPPPKS